jgi:hypothetical protein
MRDRVLFVMVGMVCAVAIGCASTKQLYLGSARPAEEVGVVKMVVNGAITSIAGRELEGRAYALLPSTYPVEFRVVVMAGEFMDAFKGSNQRVVVPCEISLKVQAGREYHVSRTAPKRTLKTRGRAHNADGLVHTKYEKNVYVNEVGPDQRVVESFPADCEWPRIEVI